MRLKLLFFPAIFVAVVVLLIWFIVPRYQDMKAFKADLKVAQSDLQKVQERQQSVTRLTSELNQYQSTEKFLLQYVPFAKDEEYVINAVNDAATTSEVGLVELNIVEVENKLFTSDTVGAIVDPAAGIVQPDGSTLGSIVVPTPVMEEFAVEASVIGSYDAIKKFIVGAHQISRLHDASMVTLEKLESDNSAQDIANNDASPANDVEVAVSSQDNPTLLGKFVFNFAHVPSVKVPRGADSPIFHRAELGIEEIANIQTDLRMPPVLDLNNDGERNNPFVSEQ